MLSCTGGQSCQKVFRNFASFNSSGKQQTSGGFLSNSSSRISKHWGSYACSLCVDAFSFVKGYLSLDSNAEAPSFMREIRSKNEN